MVIENATTHARQHLSAHPFPDDNFQWVIDGAKPVLDGWYFDYRFERIKGEGETPAFAGAIGFIVRRDGSVRDIAYGERQKLFGADSNSTNRT